MEERLSSVEHQIPELREELQREFTSVRTEMREGFSRIDRELAGVRQEATDFRTETQEEFAKVRQEATDFRAEVRGEFMPVHARMDEGFERARQLALVLYERLRSDIKAIGEGLPPRQGGQGTDTY